MTFPFIDWLPLKKNTVVQSHVQCDCYIFSLCGRCLVSNVLSKPYRNQHLLEMSKWNRYSCLFYQVSVCCWGFKLCLFTLHLAIGICRNGHYPLFSVDHVFSVPFKFSFIYVCCNFTHFTLSACLNQVSILDWSCVDTVDRPHSMRHCIKRPPCQGVFPLVPQSMAVLVTHYTC